MIRVRLLVTAGMLFAACAPTAVTTAQVPKAKFDSVTAAYDNRIAKLEAFVGKFDSPQISCDSLEAKRPATWFPNGEYDLAYRNRQFGCAFDPVVAASKRIPSIDVQTNRNGADIVAIKAQLASLGSSGGTGSPTVPTGPTIAGLSSAQIAGVIATTRAALAALPNNWTLERNRVIQELSKTPPVYSYGDAKVISAVKELYYPANTDQNIYAYLQIIDQRDAGNQPLPAGDPRWAYVSGTSGTTNPTATDNGVVFASRLVIGTCAHPDSNAAIFVCGQNDATIHFEANNSKPDAQRVVGDISLGGDHGFRNLQNGYLSSITHLAYDPVGMVNYQSNLNECVNPAYPCSTIGPDSQGRWSYSVKQSRNSGLFDQHEYTQDVAFGIDEATKTITLESWRPGWRIKFVTSSGFRTIDRPYLLTPF